MVTVVNFHSDDVRLKFKAEQQKRNRKIYFILVLDTLFVIALLSAFFMYPALFSLATFKLSQYAYLCAFTICLLFTVEAFRTPKFVETADGGYCFKGSTLYRVYAFGKTFQLPDLDFDKIFEVNYEDPSCVFIQCKRFSSKGKSGSDISEFNQLLKFKNIRCNSSNLKVDADAFKGVETFEAPNLKEIEFNCAKEFISYGDLQPLMPLLPQIESIKGIRHLSEYGYGSFWKEQLRLDSVREILQGEFKRESGVNVSAPKATTIGSSAFQYARQLTLDANQVTTVGLFAFQGCNDANIALNNVQTVDNLIAFSGSTVKTLELSNLISTDFYSTSCDRDLSLEWPNRLRAIKLKKLAKITKQTINDWLAYGDSFIIFAYDECKHLFEKHDCALNSAYERGREVYKLFTFSVFDKQVKAVNALDLMLELQPNFYSKSRAVNPPESVELCKWLDGSLLLRKQDEGSMFQLDLYTGSDCERVENEGRLDSIALL